MEWKFGVTAASDEVGQVGSTFLHLKLVVDKGFANNAQQSPNASSSSSSSEAAGAGTDEGRAKARVLEDVYMELTLPQV
jgi:hypothetical protein